MSDKIFSLAQAILPELIRAETVRLRNPDQDTGENLDMVTSGQPDMVQKLVNAAMEYAEALANVAPQAEAKPKPAVKAKTFPGTLQEINVFQMEEYERQIRRVLSGQSPSAQLPQMYYNVLNPVIIHDLQNRNGINVRSAEGGNVLIENYSSQINAHNGSARPSILDAHLLRTTGTDASAFVTTGITQDRSLDVDYFLRSTRGYVNTGLSNRYVGGGDGSSYSGGHGGNANGSAGTPPTDVAQGEPRQ